jgi:hypothetical protein
MGQSKIKKSSLIYICRGLTVTAKLIRWKIMETIEIKSVKSWKRDVIEYFEDLKLIAAITIARF